VGDFSASFSRGGAFFTGENDLACESGHVAPWSRKPGRGKEGKGERRQNISISHKTKVPREVVVMRGEGHAVSKKENV